ncbi:MAG: hypothetical protein HMLKMBBP_02583 [Planctomycetes bacterium]|nr:hypothetical protein [Planctomycetota bacterium]
MRARPSLRGFTFIELMVVITVIGIAASLSIGKLDGLTSQSRLRATSRAFGNMLLGLRQQAVIQSRELAVEIDVREQRWRIIDRPSPTDFPDPDDREERTWRAEWDGPADGVVLEDVAFARDDVQRSGVFEITFDGDGQLSPAGFVAWFREEGVESDEEGISVEVTGLTGVVDYVKGRKRAEEVRDPDDF